MQYYTHLSGYFNASDNIQCLYSSDFAFEASINRIRIKKIGARCRTPKKEQYRLLAAAGMINACHMLDEINELIGITPLVIIPCYQLYEVIIEHDAGIRIKDGRSLIMIEIG